MGPGKHSYLGLLCLNSNIIVGMHVLTPISTLVGVATFFDHSPLTTPLMHVGYNMGLHVCIIAKRLIADSNTCRFPEATTPAEHRQDAGPISRIDDSISRTHFRNSKYITKQAKFKVLKLQKLKEAFDFGFGESSILGECVCGRVDSGDDFPNVDEYFEVRVPNVVTKEIETSVVDNRAE
jgi:hypothetical protein